MHDIFSEEHTEAGLLIDEESAFNSISRKVMLHNMKFICPLTSTYVSYISYAAPPRFFIFGGDEILSKEGTIQEDPTSM